MEWEYLEVVLDKDNNYIVDNRYVTLNELGRDRWEFAFILHDHIVSHADRPESNYFIHRSLPKCHAVIFKRPLVINL